MQFPNNLRLAFGHSNLKGWIYLRQNQKKKQLPCRAAVGFLQCCPLFPEMHGAGTPTENQVDKTNTNSKHKVRLD